MVNIIMLAVDSPHEDKACSFSETKAHLNLRKAQC